MFLRQRTVVFLDRLTESLRDLIGSGQRQRFVVRVRLPAQAELELFQLVDRRSLEELQSARVDVQPIVVELLKVADDLVEVAGVDAARLQLAPQPLSVICPFAVLPTPLTDVVGVPAAVVAAPVPRVAAAVQAVRRSVRPSAGRPSAIPAALRIRSLSPLRTL